MLQLDQISVRLGDRVLIDDLSLSIQSGDKVGLVGVNGSGKSTLLKVIMGERVPDGGTLSQRQGLRIGYLPQMHRFAPGTQVLDACFSPHDPTARLVGAWQKAVETGDAQAQARLLPDMDRLSAWQYEQEAAAVLHALRITDVTRSADRLSGGEAKRVALAGVLLQQPDLLILDEPTNHLDLEIVEWLEGYLTRRRLTLLIVTHDRYFLDHICNRIFELDRGRLYSYEGNYETFLVKREERLVRTARLDDRLRNIYRQELAWMRSTPQARGGKQRARRDHFSDLTGRLQETRRELQAETRIAPLSASARLGSRVIELRGVSKAFTPGRPLFHSVDYLFSRRDRIGIAGPNGCGKTTFLQVLMGELPPDTGSVVIGQTVRFGYFGQKAPQYEPGKRVIEVVSDIADHIPDPATGQTLSAARLLRRFLFDGDRIYTPVSLLSGGELRRLYLCTVLMSNPNLLILDEPTNDLDVTTLGVLEEYLQAFDGVLVAVSHDRYFLDKLADHLFVFRPDGTIRDFPGNFTQYRAAQRRETAEAGAPAPQAVRQAPGAKPAGKEVQRKKKRTYREEQEFQGLEERITALEQRLALVERQMSSGTLPTEALLQAGDEAAALQQQIEAATERWLTLAEIDS